MELLNLTTCCYFQERHGADSGRDPHDAHGVREGTPAELAAAEGSCCLGRSACQDYRETRTGKY